MQQVSQQRKLLQQQELQQQELQQQELQQQALVQQEPRRQALVQQEPRQVFRRKRSKQEPAGQQQGQSVSFYFLRCLFKKYFNKYRELPDSG
ncbi:MAG: hypothetical protein NUV75_12035 [Gallionella sp.]|nr:hypothetical protein [Gallionella sp.]